MPRCGAWDVNNAVVRIAVPCGRTAPELTGSSIYFHNAVLGGC